VEPIPTQTCFAVVPRLCHLILVGQLFTWNSVFYLNAAQLSDYSHLCLLKCHLIFFSYRLGLTSMQHTTLHTTAVQFPSHYQLYILIDKQWYQLPEFIPSSLNSVLQSCISISIYTHTHTHTHTHNHFTALWTLPGRHL